MTKPKLRWHRPGVRVNLYFPDRGDLKHLDKLARAEGVTRSAYVLRLLYGAPLKAAA